MRDPNVKIVPLLAELLHCSQYLADYFGYHSTNSHIYCDKYESKFVFLFFVKSLFVKHSKSHKSIYNIIRSSCLKFRFIKWRISQITHQLPFLKISSCHVWMSARFQRGFLFLMVLFLHFRI